MKTLLEEKISRISPKPEWEEIYLKVVDSLSNEPQPRGIYHYTYISPTDPEFESKFIRNYILKTFGILSLFEDCLVVCSRKDETPYGKCYMDVSFGVLNLESFLKTIDPGQVYKMYGTIKEFFESREYERLRNWAKKNRFNLNMI